MGPTQATGKGRFNSVSGKRKYEISSWWVHRRNWGLLRENLELLEFNGSFTEFLAPGNPTVRQQYKVEINWRHLQISGSIYLPTYLFIYLSIYPSIHPSIHHLSSIICAGMWLIASFSWLTGLRVPVVANMFIQLLNYPQYHQKNCSGMVWMKLWKHVLIAF